MRAVKMIIVILAVLSVGKASGFEYEIIGHAVYRNYTFFPDGDGQVITEAIDLTDKDIEVPSKIYTLPTTVIAHGAFSCTDIESVHIPSSIKIIGTGAFYRCVNLKKVTLEEGLERIEAGAFGACEQLEEIELPASIKHVSRSAFIGCTNLKSIRLLGNQSLEELYDKDITGRENAKYDFEKDGCKYRISSYSDKTVEMADAPRDISELDIPATINWSENDWTVSGIGRGCFSESKLTSVKLPATIKTIGDYAFYGCTALEKIELPDGLTSIGEYAFCLNISLEELKLPKSLTDLGEGALYRCTGLKEISIPQELKRIPDYAFYGCPDATIIFPEPSVLKSIGRNAFFDNSVMTELNIPESVDTMGYLGYFKKLEAVNLPSQLKVLGAFHHCPNLSTISIPDNIQQIPHFAFLNDENLTSIHWPKFLEQIFARAFANTGFTTIEMPDTVWKTDEVIDVGFVTHPSQYWIFDGAFSDCHKLESVDLSNCCAYIFKDAFANCEQLRTVKAGQSTPPYFGDTYLIADEYEDGAETCFSPSTYLLATLQVPEGSKEAYANASNWKNFATIEDILPKEEVNGIQSVHSFPSKTPVYYNLQGNRQNRLAKGINIIRQSDGTTRKVIVK